MVVCLDGGETNVEYLNEAQKDVSEVALSFVREQACIQAVIAYTADGHIPLKMERQETLYFTKLKI